MLPDLTSLCLERHPGPVCLQLLILGNRRTEISQIQQFLHYKMRWNGLFVACFLFLFEFDLIEDWSYFHHAISKDSAHIATSRYFDSFEFLWYIAFAHCISNCTAALMSVSGRRLPLVFMEMKSRIRRLLRTVYCFLIRIFHLLFI